MHIVIDGYNLIRQSARFSARESLHLEAGREALVEALAAYKKIKAFTITVVFDGMGAAPGLARRDRLKGIELYYSRPGESADAVIKAMARQHGEKLLVVSSDHEIAAFAAACGAGVISAAEFEQRLNMARLMELKEGGEAAEAAERSPGTKKKGPARRTSKRERRRHRKIGKL